MTQLESNKTIIQNFIKANSSPAKLERLIRRNLTQMTEEHP
jgi:hypothetical protein